MAIAKDKRAVALTLAKQFSLIWIPLWVAQNIIDYEQANCGPIPPMPELHLMQEGETVDIKLWTGASLMIHRAHGSRRASLYSYHYAGNDVKNYASKRYWVRG